MNSKIQAPRGQALSRLRRFGGFGAIAVLVILVLLGSIGAALLRLSASQSMSSAAQSELSRGLDAAKAGVQWGAYQALKGTWTACSSLSQTLDLRATTNFYVTVTCSMQSYNEGEDTPGVPKVVKLYAISANACNGTSGACPDAADSTKTGYIERELRAAFKN